MTRPVSVLVVVAMLAPATLWSGDAPRFQVSVDTSKTPDATPYTEPVKALCEEWYPKINAILFGKGYPLPFKEVRIVFEPRIEKGTGADRVEAGGFSDRDTIWVNFGYLGRIKDDYRAMLVHELTHVNQQYKESPGIGWLVEGMADYVRHKYFEQDIEPRLLELDGYHVDQVKLREQGYLFGYTIASPFLEWLQTRKDENVIPTLNKALREGSYSPPSFRNVVALRWMHSGRNSSCKADDGTMHKPGQGAPSRPQSQDAIIAEVILRTQSYPPGKRGAKAPIMLLNDRF